MKKKRKNCKPIVNIIFLFVDNINWGGDIMAKNKENKPKKASKKMKSQLTSMSDKSTESLNSKTGYKEQQPNSHINQLK